MKYSILSYEFIFENVESFEIPAEYIFPTMNIIHIVDREVVLKNSTKNIITNCELIIAAKADEGWTSYGEFHNSKFNRIMSCSDIVEVVLKVHALHTKKITRITLTPQWIGHSEEVNIGQHSFVDGNNNLHILFVPFGMK